MNINVQLPSFPPINLVPATESAKRDAQLREVIPQPPASTASKSDNRTPSDQNPSRNVNKDAVLSVYSQDSLQAGETDHARHARIEGEAQQQKQEGKEQSNPENNRQGSSESKQQEQQAKQTQQEDEQARQEQIKIDSLQARHQEVVAHEQAHKNAGGQLAGSASFDYEKGPDGRSYAVSGEVAIDISAVAGDAQATVLKMQQVKRAALAPASPSGQDRLVAALASQIEQDARLDLQEELVNKGSGLKELEQRAASPALSLNTQAPPAALEAEVFPISGSGINDTAYSSSAVYSQFSNLYSDSVKASGNIDGLASDDIKSAQVTEQTLLQSEVIANRYKQAQVNSSAAALNIAV